ncbi:MAG: hypothetical protein IT374_00805 [Polyangiaceae bacterium]|nr:hypothetical protein [Polyangiaceae bacterium]
MPSPPSIWQVFLDESGDFSRDDGTVVVAGWACHADDSPGLRAVLRRALDAAYPGQAYPPHAADLNLTAGYATARALAGDGSPVILRAIGALTQDSEVGAAFAAALAKRTLPRYELLRLATHRLLVHEPALASAVDKRSRAAARRALSVLSGAPRDQCFLLGAVDRGEGREGPETEDRYLALLEVLLERVFGLLRHTDARAEVWVHTEGRHVTDGALARMPMMSRHVAARIRRAERFPLLPPIPGSVDARVRMIPHRPSHHKATCHPGVALADLIANRCHRALRRAPTCQWRALADQLDQAVLPPSSTAMRATGRQLPSVAAAGPARRAILRAFANEPGPPLGGVGWETDQATAWISAAESLR